MPKTSMFISPDSIRVQMALTPGFNAPSPRKGLDTHSSSIENQSVIDLSNACISEVDSHSPRSQTAGLKPSAAQRNILSPQFQSDTTQDDMMKELRDSQDGKGKNLALHNPLNPIFFTGLRMKHPGEERQKSHFQSSRLNTDALDEEGDFVNDRYLSSSKKPIVSKLAGQLESPSQDQETERQKVKDLEAQIVALQANRRKSKTCSCLVVIFLVIIALSLASAVGLVFYWKESDVKQKDTLIA